MLPNLHLKLLNYFLSVFLLRYSIPAENVRSLTPSKKKMINLNPQTIMLFIRFSLAGKCKSSSTLLINIPTDFDKGKSKGLISELLFFSIYSSLFDLSNLLSSISAAAVEDGHGSFFKSMNDDVSTLFILFINDLSIVSFHTPKYLIFFKFVIRALKTRLSSMSQNLSPSVFLLDIIFNTT